MSYALTEDPDIVIRRQGGDSCFVPKGHRFWSEFIEWKAKGGIPDPAPTITSSERNERIRIGIGMWIDEVVQGNGYDNAVSCASYVSSTMPKHKAEATALIAWRDAVWSAAYALLAAPPIGISTLAQVKALLPKPATFGWVADPIELIELPPHNPSA